MIRYSCPESKAKVWLETIVDESIHVYRHIKLQSALLQDWRNHRRVWPVSSEASRSRGKERLIFGTLTEDECSQKRALVLLILGCSLDNSEKFVQDFYNSVCDNTTPCFFMVSANSGDGAFPEPLILNNHIFIIFKIIFMKCCLSGVIYNTHISDCQP